MQIYNSEMASFLLDVSKLLCFCLTILFFGCAKRKGSKDSAASSKTGASVTKSSPLPTQKSSGMEMKDREAKEKEIKEAQERLEKAEKEKAEKEMEEKRKAEEEAKPKSEKKSTKSSKSKKSKKGKKKEEDDGGYENCADMTPEELKRIADGAGATEKPAPPK